MKNVLAQKSLGNTGIKVSEFCLGILPMGPLQADLPEEHCVKIIEKALKQGVTFYDTAEYYRTVRKTVRPVLQNQETVYQ